MNPTSLGSPTFGALPPFPFEDELDLAPRAAELPNGVGPVSRGIEAASPQAQDLWRDVDDLDDLDWNRVWRCSFEEPFDDDEAPAAPALGGSAPLPQASTAPAEPVVHDVASGIFMTRGGKRIELPPVLRRLAPHVVNRPDGTWNELWVSTGEPPFLHVERLKGLALLLRDVPGVRLARFRRSDQPVAGARLIHADGVYSVALQDSVHQVPPRWNAIIPHLLALPRSAAPCYDDIAAATGIRRDILPVAVSHLRATLNCIPGATVGVAQGGRARKRGSDALGSQGLPRDVVRRCARLPPPLAELALVVIGKPDGWLVDLWRTTGLPPFVLAERLRALREALKDEPGVSIPSFRPNGPPCEPIAGARLVSRGGAYMVMMADKAYPLPARLNLLLPLVVETQGATPDYDALAAAMRVPRAEIVRDVALLMETLSRIRT